MKRIYISGPMSNIPSFNYPVFHAEAARLRALGYHVENPAENPPQKSWEAYMAVCIPQMLTCDTLAMLPGWSESRGALKERFQASQAGMTIISAARILAKKVEEDEHDTYPMAPNGQLANSLCQPSLNN